MRSNWDPLFRLNRRERKGLIAVMVLLLFIVIAWISLPFFIRPVLKADVAALDSALVELNREESVSEVTSLKTPATSSDYQRQSSAPEHAILQPFDPNTASDSIWKQTGLNKGQIRTIHRYLEKGGKFRVKQDVAGLYVVSDEWYERVKPFLLLPDTLPSKRKAYRSSGLNDNKQVEKSKTPDAYDTLMVEINSADTARLRQLRGIGKVFAARIVKYRTLLGGYVRKEQLKEVYGLRPETYETIKDHVIIDKSHVKKLDINNASVQSLSRHPYITWNMAKIIVAYRKDKRPYKKVSDLLDNGLLNEELYSKIADYLTVNKPKKKKR